MNLNKIFASILAVTLMAGVGVSTAFATTSESQTGNARALVRSRIEKREAVELTDEQREEIQLRKPKMNLSMEKWDSLSDDQKEEVYSLKAQVNNVAVSYTHLTLPTNREV